MAVKIETGERLHPGGGPGREIGHEAPGACGPGAFGGTLAGAGPGVTPAALERYLHAEIPICRAMGVSVAEATDLAVTLKAPLGVNINHQSTAFGGSLSAVAILSAWSLVHLRLVSGGMPSRLVIQRNSMEYLKSAHCDFSARAEVKDLAAWPGFVRMLARKGRARLEMVAVVTSDAHVVARLTGEFVAFGPVNRSA
jgi:thioesterase domain-containing protein